jgi:hypothetical protein
MKTLITFLLFTTIVNAQDTNFIFYWGSNESLGAEILIDESFGFGFSGTTEKDKALGKFSTGSINEYDKKNFVSDTRQKWFNLYTVIHLFWIKDIQISGDLGIAMYGTHSNFLDPNRNEYYHKKKELTFRPTVGVNATYAFTKDLGIQLGVDTFSGLNVGFIVFF